MKTSGIFLIPILALVFASCPYPPDDSSVSGVTVNPLTASVDKGGTLAFTATVAGSGYPARTVIWSLDRGVEGTAIDRAGVLTVAPEETAGTLTVRATSTYDTSKSGTALVTVNGNTEVIGVTVSPETASVNKGGVFTFYATVEGTGNPSQELIWELTGNTSLETTLSGGALTVGLDETAETLIVTAASTVDKSKSGTATVTVNNVTATVDTVTVNSPALTVGIGGTLTFTATVAGTGDPAQTVTWTVSGNDSPGTTISPGGVLTVAIGETASSLTVRATSTMDTNKSGTATVTVFLAYTSMVRATPNTIDPVTIAGNSAYYYDSSQNYYKGVFIKYRIVT
jgi:hypothetical protein